MKWFENQSDTVKGLIVLLLAVALSSLAHGCEGAHARGHRFVGSRAKVRVPHLRVSRAHVNMKRGLK